MILPCFRGAFLQCHLLTVEVTKIILVSKISESFGTFNLEVVKTHTHFQPKSDASVKETSVQTTAALPDLDKTKQNHQT